MYEWSEKLERSAGVLCHDGTLLLAAVLVAVRGEDVPQRVGHGINYRPHSKHVNDFPVQIQEFDAIQTNVIPKYMIQ